MPGMEHVVDCTTGQGVDRDFEGELPVPGQVCDMRDDAAVPVSAMAGVLIPDPVMVQKEASRMAALQRLRKHALSDELTADLLTVMGLDG
jgi:hypothetical protein